MHRAQLIAAVAMILGDLFPLAINELIKSGDVVIEDDGYRLSDGSESAANDSKEDTAPTVSKPANAPVVQPPSVSKISKGIQPSARKGSMVSVLKELLSRLPEEQPVSSPVENPADASAVVAASADELPEDPTVPVFGFCRG